MRYGTTFLSMLIGALALGVGSARAQERAPDRARFAAVERSAPAIGLPDRSWPSVADGATANPVSPPLSALQEQAPARWSWGWTARGFLGGLLAGPIGTGIAFYRAGQSDVAPASVDDYSTGLADRIRTRRQEAAFVGGMVGTGIFAYALLRVLDINSLGGGTTSGNTSGGSVF